MLSISNLHFYYEMSFKSVNSINSSECMNRDAFHKKYMILCDLLSYYISFYCATLPTF